MICSTLSGKLAIKHPVHGILCREDGWVFRHNTHKKGQPYEWTPGTKQKRKGYYYIGLGTWRKGHGTQKFVHRLIAECFIPNPEHKPTVDHIDRNPSNNMVSPICNLRWATYKEQTENSGTVINRMKYGVRRCEDKRVYDHFRYRDYYTKHRDEILQKQKEFRASLTGPELEAYRQRQREAANKHYNKIKSRHADGTSCQCPDSAEGSRSALQ